jgi:iron complex transport system substrate-binding protein
MKLSRIVILYGCLALFVCGLLSAEASGSITDAVGRSVTVPDTVERAYGTAPPMSMLIHAIAPKTLIALTNPVNSAFYTPGSKLICPHYAALPVVGGWHGGSKGANMEALLALKPQVIIAWNNEFVMEPVLKTFEKFKISVVFVNENHVVDEPAALRLVGKAIGQEKIGETFAKDAEVRLSAVKKSIDAIPAEKRPTVYYAQGGDGLLTQFDGSYHFDPFLFVGAKSLFPGEQYSMMGMERVTLEEVIKKNPDVIVADDPIFVMGVEDDKRWAGIKAVKNKRVYLVPCDPVSFLDHPPTFMRVLGVQWLASVLYPQEYKVDMVKETISFYKLYLHIPLNEKQARSILNP